MSSFYAYVYILLICRHVVDGYKKGANKEVTALINDPKFKDQWYLGVSNSYRGRHNNVVKAWKQGATGKGVLIAVLDNGVQLDHPDLKQNIDSKSSFNYLNNSAPPVPTTLFDKYRHGTQMAGIIGMTANNKKCGIGVAFNAKIASVKILGPVMNVTQHAAAHSHLPQKVHIYSESYGPYDNGKIVSRYQPLTMNAIRSGVTKGRNGLGSIYVKSSGNGRPKGDHCGADGTVNIIYNIAVAAAARDHKTPFHSEECASILTSVYTQHTKVYNSKSRWKDVVTLGVNGSCIETNGGSSTATAIASGIIALALSVNRKLTWRDVQHLVVVSSKRNRLRGKWIQNGVGKEVSHKYGFGILNAETMVKKAKRWKPVRKLGHCYTPYLEREKNITVKKAPHKQIYKYQIRGCTTVDTVEQVSVVTTAKFTKRGDIEVRLTSPSKTTSILLGRRKNDSSKRSYWRWKFTSVHYWGEKVTGDWTLTFTYLGKGEGSIKNTYLIFYGTQRHTRRRHQHNRWTPRRTQQRGGYSRRQQGYGRQWG